MVTSKNSLKLGKASAGRCNIATLRLAKAVFASSIQESDELRSRSVSGAAKVE